MGQTGSQSDDIVISFDPGFTGGCALIINGKVETGFRMPVMKVPYVSKGKKTTRTEYDAAKIGEFLKQYPTATVVIEKVAARTGQGVTAMFRFGEGYGILQGIGTAACANVVKVSPSTWKKHFQIGSDKAESSELAKTYLTDEQIDTFLKYKDADNGVAEAILIGMWYVQQRDE